jgi:hypothetical protein
MNKEDMWVSRIPVPVRDKTVAHVNDVFNSMIEGAELNEWNIYSPLWCRVNIAKYKDQKVVALHDSDPFDYARAERVFPVSKKIMTAFSITPLQNSFGDLEIELQDAKGTACLRLMIDSTGNVLTKQGYRNKSLGKYQAGEAIAFKIELNTATRFYTVSINGGRPNNNLCFAPVQSVERIVFRTGGVRRFPDADTPTDQMYDLPDADRKGKEAVYYISYFKTTAIQ